jgi:hypothetical protein
MTVTVTMRAPLANEAYAPRSGNPYLSSSAALIFNVAAIDIDDLTRAGCVVVSCVTNIGTPGVGVSAAEYGDGFNHTSVLMLGAGCVLPAIAGGASLGVGTLLYTLPAGAQVIRSSYMSVGITQTAGNINANTPTVGLGTVIASGAIAVLSGTAAFQNINVGKAAANCTGSATEQAGLATSSPFGLVTDVGGVKAVYYNAAASWSASGDPGALLAGTVTLDWKTLA